MTGGLTSAADCSTLAAGPAGKPTAPLRASTLPALATSRPLLFVLRSSAYDAHASSCIGHEHDIYLRHVLHDVTFMVESLTVLLSSDMSAAS
jgi:hypothetical protein